MAQFGVGGKAPPPWQRPQPPSAIHPSLLGQHPGAATTPAALPTQQIVIGTAAPQYAPVQQSMIQPPGLGGLQSIAQSTIAHTQPPLSQPAIPQPNIVQVTMAAPNICQAPVVASLMGQPPLTTQPIQPPPIVNQTQLSSSQIPPIQPQVTAVSYPTPRPLAPPGPFNPPAGQGNVGGNVNNNVVNQQPQKQRVFTGTITKLCADFGFVDEDVFFQTSCVKGPAPKVGDRVLVEASYNPNMPFKWNANRVQVIPGLNAAPTQPQNNNRSVGSTNRESSVRSTGSYNAVPPPNFSGENQPSGGFSNSRSVAGPRARSPRRDRREDGRTHPRDRDRDREDKEKDTKRESRKRSRSRERSRSPPRRRQRVVPRYNVQVPKILLHLKQSNVLELRKRYTNLYVPSDVFLAQPLWSDTFPANRAFQLPRPVSFHIMNKEVDPVLENDAIYDPPDVNYGYAAKVMLMAVPALEDVYRRSCALSEDPSEVKECFVHPTRLINFLVGLKGKNETMAIGGYWSPSVDGPNPEKDPNVLIKTAIRTCLALTGINLSGCPTWYRFAEIYYRRGESTHKGRSSPARVETTVLFLPDVWNICPTKLEWDGLHLNYKRQLDKKLSSAGTQQLQIQQQLLQLDDQEEEEEEEDKEAGKKDPSHWALLDPRNMKVVDLRSELDARLLNSKGLKSQLIARLTKVIKSEQEKEEMEKAINEKMECDEVRRKEDEDKRREEERKKKEEDEKKKEEDERKKTEERERTLLEKRYTLPDQPMLVVHPSRTAKSGKFDCTTMSLSVLLDYRQEDNKEHSFEVSLFAEMFNEMLMRDFAFRIYRSLLEAPEKPKEEKKEKEKKDEKKEEKEDKTEGDKKEKKEDDDKDDKEEDKTPRKKKTSKDKEEKDDKKEEDEEDIDNYELYDEAEDDDSKDGSSGRSADRDRTKKDSTKKERGDSGSSSSSSKREKKEKKKMWTTDPYLLLAYVYFDQTHTGYIIDKDLEDIINMLSLNLSRAQLKKLMVKVLSRDVLYYRKLTDVAFEDKDKLRELLPIGDLEILAQGNNMLLPSFFDTSRKFTKTIKEEGTISEAGVIKHEGSLVDISKLVQQLERSEKARTDTEEKLKDIQKELVQIKDESKKATDKSNKLHKEMKSSQTTLKTMEEELLKAMEDNGMYQRAIHAIKDVIKPLVIGVNLEEEEFDNVDKKDIKTKIEPLFNGASK